MKYELMLFDMDGVMTGELFYWKTAALTVWEYLYHEDASSIALRTEEIFQTVFCDRETIRYTKRAGINTNHDLAYVVAALGTVYLKEEQPFQQVKELFRKKEWKADEVYHYCAEAAGRGWEHEGEIWHQIYDMFQSWYLGDGNKKEGLIQQEIPLFPPEKLKKMLTALNRAGVTCGIGTGRPRDEIVPHLIRWDLLDCFEQERIITQTEITNAQKELQLSQSLSKPHFYIFGKGVAGLSSSDQDVLNRKFDQELLKKTLVVGDAGADIFSAQALGTDFAAVLTGVNGQAERDFFESAHATYIFDTVFDLTKLL